MCHASDMCATTTLMKGMVDVFVLGVGVASTRQEASRVQAGVGRQHYRACMPDREEGDQWERLLTLRRDGVHRNGL